jgi:SAM domain (Sterile alpha motif)
MDIGDWLRSLGLERYQAAFRENEITEKVLPNLTAEDLKDLGVGIVGHRRTLLDALAALRADEGAKQTIARYRLGGAIASGKQNDCIASGGTSQSPGLSGVARTAAGAFLAGSARLGRLCYGASYSHNGESSSRRMWINSKRSGESRSAMSSIELVSVRRLSRVSKRIRRRRVSLASDERQRNNRR